jgi:hypothetical protein
MGIKTLFAQKIDAYLSAIDEGLHASVKQVDDKAKQLKKTNEEIQKYRLDMLVYQQNL